MDSGKAIAKAPSAIRRTELSAHTPGPWRAFNRPQGIEILCDNRLAAVQKPAAGIRIADVRFKRRGRGGSFIGSGVDEANADLIVAAPDMLTAHQSNAADLEYLVNAVEANEPISVQMFDRIVRCRARARAAIAKATGGAV